MRIFTFLALFTALSACEPVYYDTSATAFLAARPDAQIDPEIAAFASAQPQPQLQFPARITVARMVYGDLTLPTAAETQSWQSLASRARSFGTISPMRHLHGMQSGRYPSTADLRRSAAAQGQDYLIVVEFDTASGIALASFYDVRNGYLYASATASSPHGGQRGFWGGEISNPARLDRAVLALSTAILPEIEAMLNGLGARQD